jgi:two-component system phosphate regulon sensor histidine kinase PhoR
VERIRPGAEKNGITIRMNLDSSLYVSCSPTRLQQLFGNLIENAVKYNVPQGSVTITAAGQKKMAVIRVSDTGIGIAKEHFPRLFERFYRVDASRSRAVGGTGLGLSIVKHLAVLYGGEVGVESKVGEGSTFTVRLPLLPQGRKPDS